MPNRIGILGAFKYEILLILPKNLEGFLFSSIKEYISYTFNCILMKSPVVICQAQKNDELEINL